MRIGVMIMSNTSNLSGINNNIATDIGINMLTNSTHIMCYMCATMSNTCQYAHYIP